MKRQKWYILAKILFLCTISVHQLIFATLILVKVWRISYYNIKFLPKELQLSLFVIEKIEKK